MAGGLGTRLQPLTRSMPKPMLDFFDRPMIGWLIEPLLPLVDQVVLSTGHAAEAFSSLPTRYPGLCLVREPVPMGTGGALSFLREQGALGQGAIWVQNGDTLLTLDGAELVDAHRRSGAAATVAVFRHPRPDRFGCLSLASDGRILSFDEKAGTSGWINAGVYILEPELWQQIEANRPSSLERDWFPRWIEGGANLRAHKVDGYFCDLGTVESYKQAHFDVLLGETALSLGRTHSDGRADDCRTIPPGVASSGPIWLGAGVKIAPDSVLEGPLVLGADSVVGRGVHLTRCVAGPNCRIGEGAALSDCVLASGSLVEAGTIWQAAIIA